MHPRKKAIDPFPGALGESRQPASGRRQVTGDSKRRTLTNAPWPPCAPQRPNSGAPERFPRREESKEELVVLQPTGAVRVGYLKPSGAAAPVSAFTVYTAQQTGYAHLPHLLRHRTTPSVRCPAVTRTFSALTPRRQPPTAAPAAPLQSPLTSERERDSAGRSSTLRRLCGPALRGVSDGRRRAAQKPSGTRDVAVAAAAPLAEVSAGGARRARSGARCLARRPREAALAGLQAECARLPSPLRAAAHPALGRPPGASENAERGNRRGIRAARAHAPPAPLRKAGGSAPDSGGRGRAEAGLVGPARRRGRAELSTGNLRDEVRLGAAGVLKCSRVFPAPPPIIRFFFFLNQAF